MRVGTVVASGSRYSGLAVYKRRDDSLFVMVDGRRCDLHGNTRWETTSGIRFRGRSQLFGVEDWPSEDDTDGTGSSMSSGDDEAEELERAISASMQMDNAVDSEEAQIAAAIWASLQDAPSLSDPGPSAEAPSDAPPVPLSDASPPASCAICLDSITSGGRGLRCGHAL